MPRKFLRSVVEWFYAILSLFTLPWKELIFGKNSGKAKIGIVNMIPDGSGHQEYVASFASILTSTLNPTLSSTLNRAAEKSDPKSNIKPKIKSRIYIFRHFYGMTFWSWNLKSLDVINYPNFDKSKVKVVRSSVFQLYLLSLWHFFDDFKSIVNITGDWWVFQTKAKNFFPNSKVFSIIHNSMELEEDFTIPKLNPDHLTYQLNEGHNKGIFFPNESYIVQNQNVLACLPEYVKKQVFYLTQLPYYKSEVETEVYHKTFCAIGGTLANNNLIEPIKEAFQNDPELEATFWSTLKGNFRTPQQQKEKINSGTIVKFKNLDFNDLFLKVTTSDFIFVWGLKYLQKGKSGVSTMLQYVYNYQIIPIVPKQLWVDSWKLDPKIALTYSTPEELEKVVISAMKLSDQKILEMKHQIFKYFQEQTKIMKSMVENQIAL